MTDEFVFARLTHESRPPDVVETLADIVDAGVPLDAVHSCGRGLGRYLPALRVDRRTVVLFEPATNGRGDYRRKRDPYELAPRPYLRRTSRRRGRLRPVHRGFDLQYELVCGCGVERYVRADRLGHLPIVWNEQAKVYRLVLD